MTTVQDIQVLNRDGIAIDFDYSDRQLFLRTIKCIDYKEVGSSNYSYDQVGIYRFIFQINDGSGKQSYNANEDYKLTFVISISEWYRHELDIRKEIRNALSKFNILELDEVINAFSYREFYRLNNNDMDKKHNWTPSTTMSVLKNIVHDGVFNCRSFESICCELIALHERKNKDYGGAFDSTMRMFGPTALAIRLHDKVNRVISLVKNNKAEVQDEAIEDTLKDIACYAIMGLEHLYNIPKQ